MRRGEVIDGRFEIERAAGSGGMGTVYRAKDLANGAPVALKVLRLEHERGRFAREARLLADLSHPGIVRYVAHGTRSEPPYLAMEWLDGETLEVRLRRQRLTVAETVLLGRRVAEALAAAHDAGMVHRDFKPSNVLLVGGELANAKLLDFGVAFHAEVDTRATRSGMVVGTPAYMAPEQARGARDVDARADVFSLGCVLFECLTGRRPFSGAHELAILAKVLFEEAPRASELAPDLSPALDEVVARMLAKDPGARPIDGRAVLLELELGDFDAHATRPPLAGAPAAPARSLSGVEQRLVSVLMVGPDPSSASAPGATGNDSTLDASADPVLAVSGVLQIVRDLEARAERLLDGSLVVTLPSVGAATDQAARAATCALAIRALVPGPPMALATGRAAIGERWPVGDAIEQAVRLVRLPSAGRGVRLDELTARLLDERFDRVDEDGALLVGRRDVDAVRTLLGKPTPCVGRDAELLTLEAVVAQCVSESTARAVLVTGSAGSGKSRLRHELLLRLRDRAEPMAVWMARGDPIGAGGAFGLAVQLVRRAAGILDGEPLRTRREKLVLRVEKRVAAGTAPRVAAFLGEMIGAPFPDEDDIPLRTARTNAMLMGDQIRRAWEDLLEAETAARPLLIVVEDLHWGDLPTVRLLDSALRLLSERPLMVLALARPEVADRFGTIWDTRDVHRMAVGPLPRRAAERLVTSVLGERVAPERAARLVEQAGGNAFYLEELIRFEAEGGGEALPDTVLAMVEARLEALDPDARRVLRAASVYGQVFWEGGASALVGGAEEREDTRWWLEEMVRREVITRRGESRLLDETEYVFRHALLREAAYGTLTPTDRALGHRLAASWLEGVGEEDAMVLAEHFERGGEQRQAGRAYARAAGQALEGNDLDAVLVRVTKGVAAAGTVAEGAPAILGELRNVEAEAHLWRGDHAECVRAAAEAMRVLPRGAEGWGDAAGRLAGASFRLGDVERVASLGRDLLELAATTSASSPGKGFGGSAAVGCLRAAALTANQLLFAGRGELATALFDALEEATERDPSVRAVILRARAIRSLHEGNPSACLENMRAAVAAFEAIGDARRACSERVGVGFAYAELGAYVEAELELRTALAAAERMGLSSVAAAASQNLGLCVFRQGRLDEAHDIERRCAEAFGAEGDRRMEGASKAYVAAILLGQGDVVAAEDEARHAVRLLEKTPPLLPPALTTLAETLLRQGRVAEALEAAQSAMGTLETLGGIDEGEGLVRLVHAQVLEAAGRRDEAQRAIEAARARLVTRADKITDPDWRRSFLEEVPEHARTLELAGAWVDRRHSG